MSGLKSFLMELRYQPAVSALVPVDAYMGIPWQMEGGILYIPFFKLVNKNTCVLDSELFVGYPCGRLYEYKRAAQGRSFSFDEKECMHWKKNWAGGGWKNTGKDSIPAVFAALYKDAVLERQAAGWQVHGSAWPGCGEAKE